MKLLTTTSSFGRADRSPLDYLESQGCEVIPNPHGRTLTEDEVLDLLNQHRPTGLIAGVEPLTGRVLQETASFLKVISRCGTGLDNVDLQMAKSLGIPVLNTPEAPAEAVAELTIGLIFCLLRNITLHNHAVRAGLWTKKMGMLLSETTVGIMGLGRIGKRVAAFLEALGTTVIASDIYPDQAWLAAHHVTLVSADELLPASDLVTLHLPTATGEMYHYMNAKRFARMKQGAFLVNTSRGALVDEEALCEALTSEHLAGAAIDTFEQEPYKGALLNQPNVIFSPHAGSYARATRARMELEAAQNLVGDLKNLG